MIAILALSACNLTPRVDYDALQYHEANALTSNRILLLNILRSKDNAPLHFAQLSLLHGQVSEQGGLAVSQPYGGNPRSTSLPRALLLPSGSVSDAVNFDLGTLDTQDFTKGVTTPIAPPMLKYFLDSGMDSRLVLMLLISSVRLPGNQEAIAAFPRSEAYVCYPDGVPDSGTLPRRYELRALTDPRTNCFHPTREFLAYLDVMNALRRVYAVSYRPFTPVGAPFLPTPKESMQDFAALGSGKLNIRPAAGGRIQLGLPPAENEVVLCEETSAGTTGQAKPGSAPTSAHAADSPCGQARKFVINTGGNEGAATASAPEFTLRSTLGIFSFLGQVLGSQELRSSPGNDVCLRLEEPATHRPDCNTGQVLFHLTHNQANALFGVEYEGEYWGVPKAAPCTNESGFCDHTLETLSMLALLLNLNSSARDLPSTPAVQIVP